MGSDVSFIEIAAGDAGGAHMEMIPIPASSFVGVSDLEVGIAKVRELGGEAGEPADEPGFGRFSICRDSQGLHFGLH
jgi:uncharacterized protein